MGWFCFTFGPGKRRSASEEVDLKNAFSAGGGSAEVWLLYLHCFVTLCSFFPVQLKADCNKGYVTVKQVCF